MTNENHAPAVLARRVLREARRWHVARRRRAYLRSGVVPAAGAMGAGDRLVPSPVFLLSSIRSGSTMLRSVLDTHSAITAPHEMHLGDVRVQLEGRNLVQALTHLGLDEDELQALLWDRVLHRQLVHDQKSVIVDKTPRNTFLWPRIDRAWPAARYLVLLRHPEQIFRSLESARPDVANASHFKLVNEYARTLHEASEALHGLVVRYEDLTADPQAVTRRICEYLDVPWEPSMIDYGARERTRYVRGLGDWSKNIKSGRIQPAAPLPARDDVPDELREATELLGYG